ncbi:MULTISPECIES: hypothetical protein [Rhizobium]|uniref:Uncharacterized protein n=1 Tax=Rhizobium wuzhouense TaxID=1986026 RepID=A0ABX5NNG6_9HYPH|nr:MULTISPECIES: hypothetical protein [Rhizobium]PYB71825.1 hypothetical protein DMY87_16645 [Rhizobium wuzhouense]RKE79368.1 hypothetical protein DFO46_4102 [Rhizobium sp. AG855]
MSTIIIEKFVDGICVEELQVPAGPVQFLAGLLPRKAREELLRHGLDIEGLLKDPAAFDTPQWLDVEEKQVAKRVRISRRD